MLHYVYDESDLCICFKREDRHVVAVFEVLLCLGFEHITGAAKPALCMSRISQNPSYKEPQHKNLKKHGIYLLSTFL